MSEEEHHFESKAGASKTYPQQAGTGTGTIRTNGYIIKNRHCKVAEVHPKLESMAMLNVTLLELISSMERSLRILFHHPITVMYDFLIL
ncbi:hypothetical protein SAY86_020291 [Trapa natans]|uniref:Uncharacterized protein n=1 Tax=Trapa natans TaxID=22666 RepID=A0AAN7R422_TRANT|nr:hypothetical protein SAY86_020291 [Trapa natans]